MNIYRHEADVKKVVKGLLNAHKWAWWMPPGTAYGSAGISDFNAVQNGRFLAVETKFGYNKPSVLQLAYLRKIIDAGCWGFVVNDRNIDKFRLWMCHHTDGASNLMLTKLAADLLPDFGN